MLLINNHCEKNEPTVPTHPRTQPKQVREFLGSRDFINHEFFFTDYGYIGFGEVEWTVTNGDSTFQLFIPLIQISGEDTIVKAKIQVMKLPKGELPNGEVYFMNLLDLTAFDNCTLCGHVKMIGVNYGDFEHAEFKVLDNIIVSSQFYTTPQQYLEAQVEQSTKGRLKDFLACYRATRQAMDQDDVLFFVCDVTDMVMPVCSMSAAAYCIYSQTTK